MAIERSDDIADIADLGLTLSETKCLLATLQQEIVAAQVRDHAVRRPTCSRCGGGCRVKDYQDHLAATLFGQLTIRLPRFRCAACCGSESGIDWPSHCPSTPELDRLQVHLAALMAYRTAADGWFEVNYGAPSRNIVMTPPNSWKIRPIPCLPRNRRFPRSGDSDRFSFARPRRHRSANSRKWFISERPELEMSPERNRNTNLRENVDCFALVTLLPPHLATTRKEKPNFLDGAVRHGH